MTSTKGIKLFIYALPLGTVIAIIFITIIVWTLIALCIQRYTKVWRALNGVLAVASFIIILYYTIIKRTAGISQSMPFIRTIEHIRQQPELIREMVMNAFLFFPLGLTMPYALDFLPCVKKQMHGNPVFITIISAFILTCAIELIQYLCNLGCCELSDIVMNTLGVAIGSVAYTLSRRVNGGTH